MQTLGGRLARSQRIGAHRPFELEVAAGRCRLEVACERGRGHWGIGRGVSGSAGLDRSAWVLGKADHAASGLACSAVLGGMDLTVSRPLLSQ